MSFFPCQIPNIQNLKVLSYRFFPGKPNTVLLQNMTLHFLFHPEKSLINDTALLYSYKLLTTRSCFHILDISSEIILNLAQKWPT